MNNLFPEMNDDPKPDVVKHYPGFIGWDDSLRLFRTLRDSLPLKQQMMNIMGKLIKEPRLTCWHAPKGIQYNYTGTVNNPYPWTPELLEIKDKVDERAGVVFNSVFVNLYRDGEDSIGWHSDDEKILGPIWPDDIVIASVSLGATRRFLVKESATRVTHEYSLENGDLLVMSGNSQSRFRHSVPKTKKNTGERLNLTFRIVRRLPHGR